MMASGFPILLIIGLLCACFAMIFLMGIGRVLMGRCGVNRATSGLVVTAAVALVGFAFFFTNGGHRALWPRLRSSAVSHRTEAERGWVTPPPPALPNPGTPIDTDTGMEHADVDSDGVHALASVEVIESRTDGDRSRNEAARTRARVIEQRRSATENRHELRRTLSPHELRRLVSGRRSILSTVILGTVLASFLLVSYLFLDAGTRGQFTWSLRIMSLGAFVILLLAAKVLGVGL